MRRRVIVMRYVDGEHGLPGEAMQTRIASLLRRDFGEDVRVTFEPLPELMRFVDFRIHGDWPEAPGQVRAVIAACLLEASLAA